MIFKRLAITLTLLSGAGFIMAQGPISFGPKIGFNATELTTDYNQYIRDMKSGGQAGLFFSIYLDKFYLQPELYLSLKRGSFDTEIGDPLNGGISVDVRQEFSLTTVDIPLLLGYKLLDLKLARLRIWGGPVASYLLNRDYVLTVDGIDQSERISLNDFRDATWGVQFGAGLDLLMLTLDVGYEFGLEDFARIGSFDDLNLRNNLFFCSLGWRLF